MKLIENIQLITEPFVNSVVTIGNFDGVHNGHRALIKYVINKAEDINGTSVAITFEPHPIKVLSKGNPPPLITIYEQKLELIEKTGVDILIAIPFTTDFAAMSARTFVEELLIRKIGMKAIVVGNDYTFGKNREGNLELLKQYASEFGFELIVPDWVNTPENEDRISSTLIREMISKGDVKTARHYLGRYYQIRGKVGTGRNRGGKLLGFPTANITLKDELCPETGVYAVTVECSYGKFNGVANIGYSPTFDDHLFTVEAHILDFNHNLYDQEIRVNMIEKLRDEKKFNGIDELSAQIAKDVEKARAILGNIN